MKPTLRKKPLLDGRITRPEFFLELAATLQMDMEELAAYVNDPHCGPIHSKVLIDSIRATVEKAIDDELHKQNDRLAMYRASIGGE